MDNFKHKKTAAIIAVIIAAILLNPEFFLNFAKSAVYVFKPIFIGMALAFIINRPVCFISSLFVKISGKSLWRTSVTIVYIIILAAIAGIIWIIIPQLTVSLQNLESNAEMYREKFAYYYSAAEEKDFLGLLPILSSAAKKLSETVPALLADVYGKTAVFFSGIADIAIGAVVSVYILVYKNRLRVFVERLAERFIGEEYSRKIAEIYRTVYDIFSRFVSGQTIEAAVLGGLCFLGMKLFGFEYAVLISTIIGITALVPVVGAIVGTVPCAVLLFLSKPISAVWFIVFIIVLQQLENNLIYPRIVGKSTGLPPFPALIAVLIGARLGGGFGILLSVPITAVIYEMFIKEFAVKT